MALALGGIYRAWSGHIWLHMVPLLFSLCPDTRGAGPSPSRDTLASKLLLLSQLVFPCALTRSPEPHGHRMKSSSDAYSVCCWTQKPLLVGSAPALPCPHDVSIIIKRQVEMEGEGQAEALA